MKQLLLILTIVAIATSALTKQRFNEDMEERSLVGRYMGYGGYMGARNPGGPRALVRRRAGAKRGGVVKRRATRRFGA